MANIGQRKRTYDEPLDLVQAKKQGIRLSLQPLLQPLECITQPASYDEPCEAELQQLHMQLLYQLQQQHLQHNQQHQQQLQLRQRSELPPIPSATMPGVVVHRRLLPATAARGSASSSPEPHPYYPHKLPTALGLLADASSSHSYSDIQAAADSSTTASQPSSRSFQSSLAANSSRAQQLPSPHRDNTIPLPRPLPSVRRPPRTHRGPLLCSNCGITHTPLWRRDKATNLTVCNACGIYKQTHGCARPVKYISRSPMQRTAAVTPTGATGPPPPLSPAAAQGGRGYVPYVALPQAARLPTGAPAGSLLASLRWGSAETLEISQVGQLLRALRAADGGLLAHQRDDGCCCGARRPMLAASSDGGVVVTGSWGNDAGEEAYVDDACGGEGATLHAQGGDGRPGNQHLGGGRRMRGDGQYAAAERCPEPGAAGCGWQAASSVRSEQSLHQPEAKRMYQADEQRQEAGLAAHGLEVPRQLEQEEGDATQTRQQAACWPVACDTGRLHAMAGGLQVLQAGSARGACALVLGPSKRNAWLPSGDPAAPERPWHRLQDDEYDEADEVAMMLDYALEQQRQQLAQYRSSGDADGGPVDQPQVSLQSYRQLDPAAQDDDAPSLMQQVMQRLQHQQQQQQQQDSSIDDGHHRRTYDTVGSEGFAPYPGQCAQRPLERQQQQQGLQGLVWRQAMGVGDYQAGCGR
ncbi:Transcriptional regulatory protein GAT1 [Tetrabaena socialis]|uniref:Transcriptional regulatory protein GAT1 n=1 Tax=Tetrabaena socialis TaxID=47790 RepID=A0A2J8AHG9_9CHLO|nr:Transcriptional regulatory protein GAT1 [Tetrabaena socialis]|eukprot:PNH11951.1 Transcriptional regulatory protein GAT1 [Tetrabaena socialis]